jgi:signal peptidase I
MNFVNMFNLLLTIATVITGIVWLLDLLWLRRRRGADGQRGPLVDFCAGLFPVIAAVFVVRSFVFEPFRIPSGSMLSTLQIGDFILVDKYSYGLRCPVGSCKLLNVGEPKRGDVVVFIYPGAGPGDPMKGSDFIKRVIGVPGDHIQYVDKTLIINGERVESVADGAYLEGGIIERRRETLNGVTHDILINPEAPARDIDVTIPPGQYFMMGDNRDGSNDSRYWGTVPEANLKGRAVLIWMNFNFDKTRGDLSRIGTVVH